MFEDIDETMGEGELIDLEYDYKAEREYAIREQALGAAMQLAHRSTDRAFADIVIADAEKFANFLRGKAA